jgi:very-short-patch-repair endonuclease
MKYDKLSDTEKQNLINKLYINDKKSFQQIADQLNTYANKVRRDAKKFNISVRDKSEAQKNALLTGISAHPTQGKKRSESTKNKIGESVLNSWKNLSDKELKDRKRKAKKQWENMSQDQKEHMLKLANDAVRQSSKVGSKLEKFLLDKLIAGGYRVEFHKEHSILNTKLQIDLFIPKLNVAIEVDGPSHFLPVWGDDALSRNIKYDNKKTGLLLGKGCVLIRIKQTRDFSPTRAQKIFESLDSLLKNINNSTDKNRIIELGDD